MGDYNSYDSTDEDEDDDRLKIPAASPLPNPVIRSFDTPAAASTNTVPVAPAAATNRPTAQPSDDPSSAPVQPAPLASQSSTSTDPASPAPAPAPAAPAPQASQQPAAQPVAPAAQDDTSSADSAPTAPTDPFERNAALYKQFNQNEAADLKYHAAQGGATEVLPNGATVIKRDDAGNPLFKPAVVQPFVRGDDGNGYRVSRDEYGNQHYFNLADGAEGQDYHVDNSSGDQYVDVSGADGSSKREVVGRDPLVPQINNLVGQLKQHGTDAQAATLQIDRATNGTQGQGWLGAASLGDLRDNASQLQKDLKPLKEQLDSLSSYTDNNSDPSDITEKKQVEQQVQYKQDRLDTIQGEIDARDSTIADAKQRKDGIAQQHLDGLTQLDMLRRVKSMGGLNAVQDNLNTIAQGGALVDENPVGGPGQSRWQALASMGLVSQTPNADGTPGLLKVTPLGVSMLDSDTQKSIKTNPDQFMVSDSDAPVQPHVARAATSIVGMADTTAPSDSTTPPPGLGDPSATQNGQNPAGTNAPTGTDQGQPAKPYSVGQGGKVQFDPANPTASVLAAFKDGTIDGPTAETSLANARKVEAAHGAVTQFLTDHPQIAAAAEGLSTGGAFYGGGKLAVAGATASGINPAITAASLELGPFAWVPPAVAAGAEFVGGGMLASWGKKKLENQLAEYSDAVKALQSGAQAHPTTAAVAQFVPMLPEAAASLGGFGRIAGVAADDLGATATTGQKIAAGAAAVGKQAAVGAAGGAALEGIIRPAVSYSADAVLDAAGIKHDPTQAPTIGSIVQMAGLGAITAGQGVDVTKVTNEQMGSILIRGAAHETDKVPFHEVIPSDQVAARYGQFPSMTAEDMAKIGQPLTPAEQELYTKARARMQQLYQAGEFDPKNFVGTAQQATRGGAPIGVTSFDFRPRTDGGPAETPALPSPQTGSSGSPGDSTSGGSQRPSPQSPAVSPSPPAPAPLAPRVSPVNPAGTSAASGQPANPPAAGQAQPSAPSQDDKQQPTVISSASFADVAGQPGQPSTQDALTQRTQALNGQMQAALSNGQRVDMVRVGSDGTETRQQISRASDGRMVDEAGNTVRAGAALTPDTRFEIAPAGAKAPAVPPAAETSNAPAAPTSAPSTPSVDPALAKMIQTRDDAQRLLDAGKVNPEAEETTRGLVDQLSRQISAAQRQPSQSASPGAVAPGTPESRVAPTPPASRGTPDDQAGGTPASRGAGTSDDAAAVSPSAQDSTAANPHVQSRDALEARARALGYGSLRVFNTQNVLKGNPTLAESTLLQDYADHNNAVKAETDPQKLAGMHDEDYKAWFKANAPLGHDEEIRSEGHLTRAEQGLVAARTRGDTDTADRLTRQISSAGHKADWTVAEWKARNPDDPEDQAGIDKLNASGKKFNDTVAATQQRVGLNRGQLPVDAHQALADAANAGAESQAQGQPPSPTFAALKFLRKAGAEVTPELARDVDAKVQAITSDPTLDAQARTAAMKKLVLDTAAESSASKAPATLPGNEPDRAGNEPDRAAQSPAPVSTYDGVVGQKNSARQTAFAPESGTLGIPRTQMPQIAAEHRGAMAQFLQARGMDVSPQDERPDSLKPSQAEFNPGKVAKAGAIREAGDATPRRILTSSDGHVIDGHHQWLDRLQNAPTEPMPTLKINAPARDILSQIHEFPSAGMENAPDIPERTVTRTREFDSPNTVRTRAWLADQRAAGNNPSAQDIVRAMKVRPDIARRLLRDQDAAETASASASTESTPTPANRSAALSDRQPVTPAGIKAKKALVRLQQLQDNGIPLDGAQRDFRRSAEYVLAHDLNQQVLGPDPQPVTEAGQRAQRRLADLAPHIPTMNAGQLVEIHGLKTALENDFTQQRLAIEAKQAQSQAPKPGVPSNNALSGPAAPPSAPSAPAAPTTAPKFKPRQEVLYQGRNAVVESIDGDRADLRVRAGQDPKTGANLVAKRVRGVPLSSLQAKPEKAGVAPGNTSASQPAQPAQPIDPYRTADTARKLVAANREMLGSLGVRDVQYGGTQAASGIEFGDDGTLHLDIPKLAKSMATVRDNQASRGIESTPEDWFSQVLAHEGIHAADAAVARTKGQTLQQRYEALPAEAMPEGWQAVGRDVYGAKNWDALPEWKQKAEFVRQVIEGKWTGRLTEALYKFIQNAVSYLKSVAGFENADPRFKAHIQEVESRIEAARASEADGNAAGKAAGKAAAPTFRPGGRAAYGRRAATVQAIDGDTATIVVKGSKAPIQVPVAELKPPIQRRFVLPSTPTGEPDIIDHVAENGGMRGSVAGKRIAAGKGIDVAGDYDDRPNLKGVYQNAVFGGQMTPDQMASALHEDYGHGDGTVPTMYRMLDQAMQSRESGRAEQERQAEAEKQTTSFDKDAVTQGTAKGKTEVSARDLNVGDHVTIGNQTLKVIDVDPDTMDVTLEDHTKYGVQTVADGQKLYVEKVEPGKSGSGDQRLAAARPDHDTGDLFGGTDDPFNLRGELASPAERVAAAREAATQPPAPADDRAAAPTLRPGEKGTGDLFQGDDQPFNLAGEAAIDHGARQQEQQRQEQEKAAALEKQYRAQGDLFNARPTETGTRSMGQVPLPKRETFAPPAPAERLDLPAPEAKPATEIADFGEKIGGARKDTARPLGSRPKADVPAATADLPAWQRKYVVSPETRRDYMTRTDKPTGKFVVERTDGVRVRTPTFDTPEEAQKAIPLIEAARNHGVSYSRKPDGSADWHIFRKVGENKRPVVKSGFASDADAKTYLATHPQEMIEHKFAFPERPWLDRLERRGGTERTGDVSPKMFQDAFGFRGGEFGNWNKGGDGQAALNHAYDALHDLADSLGVSPKALSLNGELAIAFGARGHGGAEAAAAHYEPGHQVINMTKIKGAGSLAHEWFHALDHYLGRQDGKATDRTQAADAREASGRDPSYVRNEYASHGFSRQSGTREELRNAFKKVMDATVAKPTEVSTSTDKLADMHATQAKYVQGTLDDLRRQFTTQHTFSRSKKAATPEQLAEFDRLSGQIARGDVGEKINVPPAGGRMSFGRMSYQPIEDLNALHKSVLGRSFATNEEGSQGRRLYWQLGAMKDAQQRVANAGEGGQETQTRNVSTDFLKEARKIDSHRASDYWSLTHEMGARSFESFVADKLENSARKNDYLVHGADNHLYAQFGLKPYPEGEERAGLNRAWQHVFDTIQEKPTERGSALAAAAAEPTGAGEAAPEPRETRVPVPQQVFDRLSIPRGNVFADYAALAKKHPEFFNDGHEAKAYVEHVMEAPTEILPGNQADHRLIVRSNGEHKAVALEVEMRGGKYRVKSAHTLSDQQLTAKRIAAGPGATLGVSRVDPEASQETPSRLLDTSRNAPPDGEQNVTTPEPNEQSNRRGSTQVTLSPQDARPIQNYVRAIPDHLLYSERNEQGREKYGRELEPHVTSLYGLTGQGDTPEAVHGAVGDHGPVKFKLGKLSLFSNPDQPYDVLKSDVESPDLHALNAKLRSLPHQSDYPDYQPHMTLAYLKKGEGDRFVGRNPFQDRELTAKSLTHSPADRTQGRTEIPLDQPGSGSSGARLGAAEPEPVDEADVKPEVLANPVNRRAVQQSWKKLGTDSPMFKNWFGDWKGDPSNASKVVDAGGKPLVVYHGSPELAKGGGFDTFRIPKDAGDLLAGTGAYLTDSKQMGQSYTLNRDALLSGAAVDAKDVPASTPVMPLYANIKKPFPAGAEGLDAVRAMLAKELPDEEFAPPPGRVGQGGPGAAQVKAQEIDSAIQNVARTYGENEPLLAYRALKSVLADYGQVDRYAAQGDPVRDVLERHGFDGIQHEGGVEGGQKHQVFVAFDPAQVKSAAPAGGARSNSGAFDPKNPSTLAAAAPEPADDPSPEHALFGQEAAEPDPAKKGLLARVLERMIGTPEHRATVDDIASGKDAAQNMAGRAGRQAKRGVELDIRNDLDRQAAGAVVEAGYDPRKLAADLARVQASPDQKLAKQYAPIYQRAIDNLPRLRDAAAGWRQRDVAEDAAAERAGLTPQAIARAKHIYDDPTSPRSTIAPDTGFGATKGFKTAADALAAGVDPKSINLGDLAEKRVTANQNAINERLFQNRLSGMRAADGKPVLGGPIEVNTQLNPDGTVTNTQKVPKGYDSVQAGPNVLTVHKEFSPLLKSLYGESAFRQGPIGNALVSLAGLAKHGTAVFDAYHGMRELAKQVLGFQDFGYGRGLAALDYAPEDRPRAIEAGKITQKEADWANAHDAVVDRGLKAGLNVGKVADNLLDSAKQHGLFEKLPVVGKGLTKFNDLIFHKQMRGAMTQAFTIAAERNAKRFPDLSQEQIDRRSAKEVNEFFGNLGNQGLLKNKTLQDAARMIGFAPQWTESQIRSEVRGYGQMAKAGSGAMQGKGLKVGVIAQAMGGSVLAGVVAAQALNIFTRGKPTWRNQEDGHQWDAWIPGGPNNRGFWFSPLSIGAEYAHEMHKYMEGGMNPLDAATHIATNKLSGPARGVKDLLTGEDYAGRPFHSMGERLKAAATDVAPFPMPATGMLEKNPKSPIGYGLNHQPGSLERQGISMLGLKVDAEPSARSQTYRMAQPFRTDHGGGQHAPSEYSDLRRMLDNNDLKSATAEIGRLVHDEHKPLKNITKAMGIREDGSVKPEIFTGSHKAEARMLHGFTPEQRRVYGQAQKEHTQIGMRFKAAAARSGAAVPAGA